VLSVVATPKRATHSQAGTSFSPCPVRTEVVPTGQTADYWFLDMETVTGRKLLRMLSTAVMKPAAFLRDPVMARFARTQYDTLP